MTQENALKILKTGRNVFLTGEPGAGKSFVVNQYVSYLRQNDISVAVTASTGIAATHIGGMTIHSWSGLGIREYITPEDIKALESNRNVTKKVRGARVLIIDEVSMLKPELLDCVNIICKKLRSSFEPFGGLQVVFVGDFFQLPPIKKRSSYGNQEELFSEDGLGTFAYSANSWHESKPAICYLTEQHRQQDSNFTNILSSIRKNIFDEDHLSLLEKRQFIDPKKSEATLRLFSHNANVDKLNDDMLSKLPGKLATYQMTSRGPESMIFSLKKGCLSPEILNLKIGASVMFTKNSPKDGFVNGTLGKVIGFEEDNNLPIIRTRNGRIITADYMDWGVESDGYQIAKISQLPLRLAWAITVHKSQGMSLDEAIMDLSAVFEYGQGYVALSRVKSLEGLYLQGWNSRAFEVHPEILMVDSQFRQESDNADMYISNLDNAEFQSLASSFLGKTENKETTAQEPKDKSETKQDTYSKTLEMWRSDIDIDEIAKSRDIKPETVISHLERLLEDEKISMEEIIKYIKKNKNINDIIEIRKYIKETKADKLKPVFDHFNEKYSYKDIRIAMLTKDAVDIIFE